MSFVLHHQPATYSFKNTLNDFGLEQANEEIQMILYFGDHEGTIDPSNIAFVGNYTPDAYGDITINVRDIVSSYLSTKLPSGSYTLQTDYMRVFSAVFKGVDSEQTANARFWVANAEVSRSAAYANYIATHFMSTQPSIKHTTATAQEYLTFFAATDTKLRVKYHTPNGAEGTEDVFTSSTNEWYSVDVSPAEIEDIVGLELDYYTIELFDTDNEVVKCAQRYNIDAPTEREKYYLWVNKLGGIDSFVATGENVLQPVTKYNIGKADSTCKSLDDSEDYLSYKQDSGYCHRSWRTWLADLVQSKAEHWKIEYNKAYPIVIMETDFGMSDYQIISSFNFTYRFAQ